MVNIQESSWRFWNWNKLRINWNKIKIEWHIVGYGKDHIKERFKTLHVYEYYIGIENLDRITNDNKEKIEII